MKTKKRLLSILLSLVMVLGLMSGMSLTALAESDVKLPRQLLLSLSGAQYGSYKVSVNGEDTTLSTDGSTQIAVYTNDVITVTFSPKENGRVEKFYLEDSNYYEYHHEKDIVSNSYTFTLTDQTEKIVVWFGYKNRVENVSYVDELGAVHTVAAAILTGAETLDYHESSYNVVLGEDNKDTWYAVTSNVTYSRELDTRMELLGNVHLIVADGATLSVKSKIKNGSFYGVIDTLSIYGQTNQTGTVSVNTVECDTLNLYSGKLTVDSVNNNTVNIKGGTFAVSGNVDAEVLDISGGTTTISGKAYMENLTLGCRSVKDSITISAFERRGSGTTKYADGQQLTDGIDVYSGPIYDNTWPNGKTLRKVDTRDVQTITVEDMTVTYGDTDKSVSGTTDGDGAISYAVKEGSADYIDVDTDTGKLTIKKVPADGKAYVTIKAEGTEDYKETTRDITVTINKAVPTVSAPTAKTLTCTGSAQELVNAGSTHGGTLYYAVTSENTAPTDDNLYTTSIPTATDAGTYYVWYMAKGDENHNNSEADCIPVTITATYTVTYKVVGGTWSDGSTTDKTETVQSGSKPASVPTGMKASEGYTSGAWDTNPTEATITEATTFTYTFEALPTYTVTYKVVNGTWSDGSTTDKTETVQSGSKPANVPTGMIASSGYTGGAWDTNPAEATITEAKTFTYTFTTKQASTVTKAPTAKNLTYNGQAQALVTAGTAEGGEMQYALGTKDAATEPYTTSIPTKTDAGTYYVWYKVAGDENHNDSEAASVTVTITKAAQAAPAAPTAESVTENSVTLKKTDRYQYSMDGTTWQNSNVFSGLSQNTEYTFYQRIAGDENHEPSPAGQGTAITTGSIVYTVTESKNTEHTIGSGDDAVYTVKRNVNDADETFKNFTGATVDGSAIPDGGSTAKFGSLVLTLKSSYLDTLSVGDHNMKISFVDGTVEVPLKIKAATPTPSPTPAPTPSPTPHPVPQTGDNDNPVLWVGLILLGIAGLAVLGVIKASRKRR